MTSQVVQSARLLRATLISLGSQRVKQLSRSVQCACWFPNLLKLNMSPHRLIPNKNTKNKPPSFAFSKTSKTSHFTLLMCRGRQRNVQSFVMHVYSHCSTNHKKYYNFLDFDWFKKLLVSTNLLAKLLSDLLLDSLVSDSLLSDSSISQSSCSLINESLSKL